LSSLEEEVISYVALTGDLETVTQARITADHFLDPNNRRIFEEILTFRADFGEPPTPEVIQRDHPGFAFRQDSSGPLDYLVRELHEARRRVIIDLGLDAVADALDKNGSEAALPLLRMMLAQATTASASSREINYAATGAERLAAYRQARENPGQLLGITTGFRFLDKVTLGVQPQQMIVLTGLAKSCKTTVMLGMTRSAYDYGAKPLLISFEMPYAEIARRLDGFLAQVNPRKLQTGDLSPREWQALEKALSGPLGDQPYVITEDRAGVMTLTGIQSKIDQLSPSVVFIDGAYFLFDEVSRESQTPLALTNISRGLKKLALNNDIPVVVTTQSLSHKVGAKGLTANSLGYTSAWVQDADLVVGMEATDEDLCYRMKVLASRNAPPQENLISISWDPPAFEEEDVEDDLPY
jgi:replicative DNA helicase